MKQIINGIQYHIEAWGEHGTPLFFLHGFTGCGYNWEPIAQKCAPYHRVFAPNLIGHGQTEKPTNVSRYAFLHVRQDLLKLIDTLCPDEPVHMVGYSMGGRIALDFAIHYPTRLKTLTLESATYGITDLNAREARRQSDEALAQRILDEGIESFVGYWEKLPLWETQQHLPASTRQQQRIQRLANLPIGLANSLRGHGTGTQTPHLGQLHTLLLPILLITGKEDEKFTAIANEMVTHLPNARHTCFSDTGHTTHLENPEGFAKTILEFLAEYE